MNKTKAKGLIKKLDEIDDLLCEVDGELNFENLLSYAFDYTSITRNDLKKRYNIK